MYSKANQKSTVGFVLHAVPYQENSLLVDAITADYGRVSFVARGARSKRSSLKAALQVFVPLKLTLGGMDKSLKNLVRCEVSGRQFQYVPPVLFSALYANELIAALYRIEDNSQILFAAYLDVLTHLEEGYPESWTLRQFELVLLEELGYGIDLSFDCSSGTPIGADIIALRTGENLSSHAMQAMKNLIKKNLDILLDGKVLYSRELYRDYLNVGKSIPALPEKDAAESSDERRSVTDNGSSDGGHDNAGAGTGSDETAEVSGCSASDGSVLPEPEKETPEASDSGTERDSAPVPEFSDNANSPKPCHESEEESPDQERDENFDL